MRVVAIVAVFCCLGIPALPAAEPETLEALLKREVIGPNVALEEVQQFTEDRVPKIEPPADLDAWKEYADGIRRDVLENVVFRGAARSWRDAKLGFEMQEVIKGPGYFIRKLRYEALPGLWIPALLYVPEKLDGKVPVVLNVNGHDRKGKAAPYKQLRCINQAKRGMIALNVEWLGMGQLRSDGFTHYRMNQLDLCGTSGLAPFYLAMKRGIDVLLSLEHADPQRVAVAGLSGGGWQTIFISSLDTRVTLANPVAGYSSFRTRARNLSDLGDSEQTPSDLATAADYAHLTALMAPRGLLLTYNVNDNCCFASGHALPPLLKAAEPIYKLYGQPDRLRSHVNHDPGTHNFEQDNRQALYRMLGDVFYAGSEGFATDEIESESEIKTAEQLEVALPEGNADFHTLALDLMRDLPRTAALPTQRVEGQKWQRRTRADVQRVVRGQKYNLVARQVGEESEGDVQATYWHLRIGSQWTVPAVELVTGKPQRTTVVLADAGRAGAAERIAELLAGGSRVVAIDPFYFGESKIAKRDFLFALLVAAVGERPLGIQASQTAAVARWLHGDRKLGDVTLIAHGPRTSLIALTATALQPQGIAAAQLHGAYGSLKEIIERNNAANTTPEQFCFGLLETADVKHLVALAAPREVQFVEPSERARQELAELRAWYTLLGREFDPLAK